MSPRPLVLLIDGVVRDDVLAAALDAIDPRHADHAAVAEMAVEITARAVSFARRRASVAVCRLGPTASRTLRRFAAGQEITR